MIILSKGVEDLDNWHGKPMSTKTEDSIAAIKALIVDPKAHIDPIPPTAVVEDVDISNICLDSPPNYKLGEKVGFVYLKLLSMNYIILYRLH